MFPSSVMHISYSEKTSWVIEPVDYTELNDHEIEVEYKKLRKELQYINEEVIKAVQKVEIRSTKKMKLSEPDSSKVLEIRDREIDNSNAIL